MLPCWHLLDILRWMKRDDLERIQVTNQMLNDIVKRVFASHPFRTMPKTYVAYVQIRNGELVLLIHKNDGCLLPYDQTWTGQSCRPKCDHYFPINVMRPFLRKNVRFGFTKISNDDKNIFTPYTTDHIATLESISHIWAERNLCVYDFSNNDSNSLSLILGSSSVFQCRTFHIWDTQRRIGMLQNPYAYTLHAIELLVFRPISADEMLQLIQQKESYPCSDTIFVFNIKKKSLNIALETAKQNFLKSEDRCLLRSIITTLSTEDIMEFRIKNARTREVLQLKHISKKEANDEFDLDMNHIPALFFERCTA